MSCRGIHNRYKTEKQGGSLYKLGYKRCGVCEVFYDPENLRKHNLTVLFCPCCKYRLKSKPNSRIFKQRLIEEKTS